MTIYRKGENQFGLHESARLGQNKREMERRNAVKGMTDITNPMKAMESSKFLKEDIARQISYEAGLEDTTVAQHRTANNMMNAVGEMLGITEDLSVPISGDDLARGAAGRKALEQLDFD